MAIRVLCSICFALLLSALSASSTRAADLVVSEAGTIPGRDHVVYVESPGTFKLGLDWGYNYGLTQWYDLTHDPAAMRDLTQDFPAIFSMGQSSLHNYVFYPVDYHAHGVWMTTIHPDVPRSVEILEQSPVRAVIRVSLIPAVNHAIAPHLPIQITYTIYSTGRIGIHQEITNTSNDAESCAHWFVGTIGLGDPQYRDGYETTYVESSGTVIDSSTIEDLSVTWAPDEWVGFTFYQSGAGRRIVGNTAHRLSLEPGSPDPSNAYYTVRRLELFDQGAGVAIDATTLEDPSKSWTPGEWAGRRLTQPDWLSFEIVDNTAQRLILAPGSSAISATYKIVSSKERFGWVPASCNRVPSQWEEDPPDCLFTYWDPSTPGEHADWSRASVLLARSSDLSRLDHSQNHTWNFHKRHTYDFTNENGLLPQVGDRFLFNPGVTLDWTWMMQLGAEDAAELPDIQTLPVAQALAGDYLNPSDLIFTTGSAGSPAFDEAEACYSVVASNDRIVLSFDGSTRTRFTPAFRLANYKSQARPKVTVSGMPDVEYASAVIGNDTAIVQILEDIDQLVTVSIEPGSGLTIRDAAVVEGASGAATATFEVELAGE